MLTSTRQEVLRLAAAAAVDPRTATKWLAGGQVMPGQREALEREAERLGIKSEGDKHDVG